MEPQTHAGLVKRALAGDKEALDICDIGNHKVVPCFKAGSFNCLCADFKQVSQTTKSRHTGAGKLQTRPAHLIPHQGKIPQKESGN